MDDDTDELTLDELAERASTSPRTVRFYIAQGLLPGPGARGKAAAYGEEHLTRLRLVRLLSEQHVPLAKIRALLAGLTEDDLREMLAREEARAGDLRAAERAESPKAYIEKLLAGARAAREMKGPAPSKPPRLSVPWSAPPAGKGSGERGSGERRPAETWRRWVLAPGVELHVRLDAGAARRELIERLLATADARAEDEDN